MKDYLKKKDQENLVSIKKEKSMALSLSQVKINYLAKLIQFSGKFD